MKKISTLGFGLMLSIASFAGMAPNRLTVAAEGSNDIKVTIDGNRFEQQSFNNSVVFENLQPGYHAVKIYQQMDRRGWFGRRQGNEFRLIYSTSVNIKPLMATSIEVSRSGRAQINEQPMRETFNRGGWDRDDHRGARPGNYDHSYVQPRVISDQDFFAAERVMEREHFDDARMLYAKRLVDDNYLTAAQVKDLARFFTFDNNRIEFAKYAFSKTTDRDNYSVVCNAFSSGSSREQLMGFIRSYR